MPVRLEKIQRMNRGGRGVQADSIGQSPVLVGVVGEDQGRFLAVDG